MVCIDVVVVESVELGMEWVPVAQRWDCADKWLFEAHLMTKQQCLDCEGGCGVQKCQTSEGKARMC